MKLQIKLKSAILILPSLHLVVRHIEYRSIYAYYEDIIVKFSGYHTWDAPPSNVQSKTNCFSRERLALRTSSGSSIGSIRTHIYQTKKNNKVTTNHRYWYQNYCNWSRFHFLNTTPSNKSTSADKVITEYRKFQGCLFHTIYIILDNKFGRVKTTKC